MNDSKNAARTAEDGRDAPPEDGEGKDAGRRPEDGREGGPEEGTAASAGMPEDVPDAVDPRRPASGNAGRRIILLLVLMPLLVAALAGAGIWHTYATLYDRPVEMTQDRIEIVVPEGASATQALDIARQAGMALPRWETRLLMRFEPELLRRIHVGRFRFERGMTPHDVLATLSGPALVDQQLRIPEGATVWEVMALVRSGNGLVQKTKDLPDEEVLKLLGLENRRSLEGLLAPETYRYGTGTTDVVILRKAVDHQRRIVDAAWAGRSGDCQAKDPYELLVLASIIEKETGEKGDRGLVSSVFNNRLKRGMPLQTDPTVIYGLGPDWSGRLRRKDLETPSPWNTYTFAGLPPTPISMFLASSVVAAARPTKSKFLYFVARGDGTSEFSETLGQHNRAVQHFIIRKRTTPLPGSRSPAPAGTADGTSDRR